MKNIKTLATRVVNKVLYDDNDALSEFAKNVRLPFMRDRFGYLNKFSKFNMSSQNDIFPQKCCKKSLEQILIERAIEVLSILKKKNKVGYVLWSGGVDSTAILLSLLEVDNKFCRNNVGVLYTQSSIKEYPILFNYINKTLDVVKEVNGTELYDVWCELSYTDYVISGYPADQLFGSIINQSYKGMYFVPWEQWINSEDAVLQFKEAFSYYDLPIKTFGQFVWFMNFACKWDVVNKDVLCHIGKDDKNTINFFDTQDFQDWSVSNFDKLHLHDQNDSLYYKKELKEFCNKYFPDKDFLYHKGKEDSIVLAGTNTKIINPFVAVVEDNDKVVITNFDRKLHKNSFNFIQEKMLKLVLDRYRK